MTLQGGEGAPTPLGPLSVITTNADTPLTIGSNLATQISQADSVVSESAE
jgi:hypothetical protein